MNGFLASKIFFDAVYTPFDGALIAFGRLSWVF